MTGHNASLPDHLCAMHLCAISQDETDGSTFAYPSQHKRAEGRANAPARESGHLTRGGCQMPIERLDMLELVPPGVHIDFIGKAKIWISISAVVILIGIASIVWRGGVNQGIDFSGG